MRSGSRFILTRRLRRRSESSTPLMRSLRTRPLMVIATWLGLVAKSAVREAILTLPPFLPRRETWPVMWRLSGLTRIVGVNSSPLAPLRTRAIVLGARPVL